jgi:hypothetical protein
MYFDFTKFASIAAHGSSLPSRFTHPTFLEVVFSFSATVVSYWLIGRIDAVKAKRGRSLYEVRGRIRRRTASRRRERNGRRSRKRHLSIKSL